MTYRLSLIRIWSFSEERMTPDRLKEDSTTHMDHTSSEARSLLPATCHEGISKGRFSSRSLQRGQPLRPMPARIYLIPI